MYLSQTQFNSVHVHKLRNRFKDFDYAGAGLI